MIFPLADSIALALSFFYLSLSVEDMLYVTAGGQDVSETDETRTILAAVDPSRSRQMEYLFGGSLSDGDIGVYTLSELYSTDLHAPGTEQRQSFLTYQGVRYRVADVSDWQPQANMRVYLAKRHVEQYLEASSGGSSS